MRISSEPIIKTILGSKVKRKILAFLFSKQGAVSERELSRVIGVSHTAVNKAMKQLLELNLVSGKTIGSALIWELNEKSLAYPYAKMLTAASVTSSRDHLKDILKQSFEDSRAYLGLMDSTSNVPNIRSTYLFGSVADGTSKPESDIDVLVVLEFRPEKALMDKLAAIFDQTIGVYVLEKTGNSVSFHIYDQKAVEQNEPSWLKDAIQKGIKVC
ncbi:nucleotidyltransferase domain-containing protein [Candidatus Micrarchaeota archaeon]|nr:nucleotidyltransferase domain-containing protein [Candidatus Micrarchaeota archaeon]